MYHLLTKPAAGGRPIIDSAPMRECGHGPGHAPADAVELADVGLVRRRVDGAGGEEQGDLAEGMRGDVQRRAGHRQAAPGWRSARIT